jgi:hypothetical protein
VRGPFIPEDEVPGPRNAETKFREHLKRLGADGAIHYSVIHRCNLHDVIIMNEYACQGIPVKAIPSIENDG